MLNTLESVKKKNSKFNQTKFINKDLMIYIEHAEIILIREQYRKNNQSK